MITKEELESKILEGNTLTKIAEDCKVSISTIRRWIEKYDIEREKRKSPTNIIPKRSIISQCPNCGSSFENAKHGSECCSPECAAELKTKRHYEEYLKDNSIAYGQKNMQSYKKWFLLEQNNKCSICGMENSWNGQELIFILDHIDGNADNNNRDNLRMVCPNCDSQLDTFKSKNKNSARAKYRKT